MRYKVKKEYDIEVGYNAWVIAIMVKFDRIVAVVLYEDGTLAESDIKDLELYTEECSGVDLR